MGYITVYRTLDSTEISLIRHKFEDESLDFQVLDEHTNAAAGVAGIGGEGMRIQVEESQKNKAKEYLRELGFLNEKKADKSLETQPGGRSKWVAILFAALVVIIIIFIIVWFMDASY